MDLKIEDISDDSNEFSIYCYDSHFMANPEYIINCCGTDQESIRISSTARIEGTFSYEFYGTIRFPEILRGKYITFNINESGSNIYDDVESEGYTGGGFLNEEGASVHVWIKPSIAKDILDCIFVYRNSINVRTITKNIHFRIRCVNSKYDKINSDKEYISFKTTDIYFGPHEDD